MARWPGISSLSTPLVASCDLSWVGRRRRHVHWDSPPVNCRGRGLRTAAPDAVPSWSVRHQVGPDRPIDQRHWRHQKWAARNRQLNHGVSNFLELCQSLYLWKAPFRDPVITTLGQRPLDQKRWRYHRWATEPTTDPGGLELCLATLVAVSHEPCEAPNGSPSPFRPNTLETQEVGNTEPTTGPDGLKLWSAMSFRSRQACGSDRGVEMDTEGCQIEQSQIPSWH